MPTDPDLRSRLDAARERADPVWHCILDFIDELPKSHELRVGVQSAHRGDYSDSLSVSDFLAAVTPPEPVRAEIDAAWERIMADSEGPIRWEKTTTGYQLLEAAVKRELSRRCAPPADLDAAKRVSGEAVAAAERALQSYADHGAWRPSDVLAMANELLRLARPRPESGR